MNDNHLVPGLNAKLTMGCFGALAVFIYLPAFVTTFGIHNDYCFLGYTPSSSWLCFPETNFLMALGRPLGAVLLNVERIFLHSLGSFFYGRLVSFALSLGSAWLIVRHLTDRLNIEPLVASAIGFCFVLMPACQVFIMWLTNLVPGSLNVLLSLLFYGALERADLREIVRGHARSLGWMTVAMSCFLLTLLIYPPTALTFLALTFANLLFSPGPEWPRVRLEVVRDLVFAGTGMVVYFVATKFVMLPLFGAFGSEAYQKTVAHRPGWDLSV